MPKRHESEVSKTRLHSTPVFAATLFTRAKERKQLEGPSGDEWVRKTWSVHVEYSFFKRKEILTQATMCMNVEDSTFCEMSQSQKDKCGTILLK